MLFAKAEVSNCGDASKLELVGHPKDPLFLTLCNSHAQLTQRGQRSRFQIMARIQISQKVQFGNGRSKPNKT